MQTIVTKFGGSSLADAAQFRKVADIIHSNPARRFVVASAPGKRTSSDIKVTDLLYTCCDAAQCGSGFESVLSQIRKRFNGIKKDLGLDICLDAEFNEIRAHLRSGVQRDYMASRGEYLNSKILAAYLGFSFVDPADMVCFDENGVFDAEKTNERVSAALSACENAVIPGFYGAMPDGTIKTFSRGGSDITGSIVARGVGADLYENWTDVSGLLSTDPRIVENPKGISCLTYRELRELSYMGASVMHEDAIFPVHKAGIPINIRNTNAPEDKGTMIVAELPDDIERGNVTGIAGKKGFTTFYIEKSMMNGEIGFGARLLGIIASHGIAFEHCPSGIDTMSVVVSTEGLGDKREIILEEIREQLHPDHVAVIDGFALIAVVGHGMVWTPGMAGAVFRALEKAHINVRMIDLGSSGLNIITGVREEHFEDAVRAIYREMEHLI